MSKYLQCYEIGWGMILELTKQAVIMITGVLDVKKVAHDLSGPLVEIGASEANNKSSNPPEIFHKMLFYLKNLIGL